MAEYRTAAPCARCRRETVAEPDQTCEECTAKLELAQIQGEWEQEAARGAKKSAGRSIKKLGAIAATLVLSMVVSLAGGMCVGGLGGYALGWSIFVVGVVWLGRRLKVADD